MKKLCLPILLVLLFPVVAMAKGPQIVPESREFRIWKDDIATGKRPAAFTASGRPLGRRPSPVDYSHLKGKSIVPTSPDILSVRRFWSSIPTDPTFDLRAQNALTPIKNQNPTGSCWAFSTIAAAESAYKKSSGTALDLSESHLVYYGYHDVNSDLVGFDLTDGWSAYDYGGYAGQAAAILFRGTGAVSETDASWDTAPYPSNGSGVTPTAAPRNARRINNIYIIPQSTNHLDQKENIKYALKEYGAVSIGMYWVDNSYNTVSYGYHYNGNQMANHQVTIVGWDDNYSRTNFKVQPAGDGAWIVRNSWGDGTEWPQSDDGYFYISYHDNGVLGDYEGGFVFMSTDPTPYAHTYSHTPLGQTGSLDAGSNTNAMGNVFAATSTHRIGAVGLVNPDVNTTYELKVYTNVSGAPDTGTLVHTSTGTLAMPGFLTIPLTDDLRVESGEKFAVTFALTTPNTTQGIPIEFPYAGINTSKATSEAGQSYVWNGAQWVDIYDSEKKNVCIYAFALDDNTGAHIPPVLQLLF